MGTTVVFVQAEDGIRDRPERGNIGETGASESAVTSPLKSRRKMAIEVNRRYQESTRRGGRPNRRGCFIRRLGSRRSLALRLWHALQPMFGDRPKKERHNCVRRDNSAMAS